MTEPILWYFADPMCSWCWGFSPVIETIREEYRDRMKIALILGGLRAETAPMNEQQRAEILHHWQDVNAMTGQTFQFEGALPTGFVYDTEPACRAVVTVSSLDPEATFPMFKAIQSAFYTAGQDVTQPAVLAGLAESLGVATDAFLAAFDSQAARDKTLAHFKMSRQLGIRGFPSLVLQNEEGYRLLTNGYRPVTDLRPEIDAFLE